MADRTVFYAWQSQSPKKENRYFIEEALEQAIKSVNETLPEGFRLRLEQDARGAVGAVEISTTLLEKIASCAVFVGDVTLVGTLTDGRSTPNPNVLFELGYAWRARSGDRAILMFNSAYGKPEELPFDISKKVMVIYSWKEDAAEAHSSAVKALGRRLKEQIAAMLKGDEWAGLRAEGATDHDITLFAEVCANALAAGHDFVDIDEILPIGAALGLDQAGIMDAIAELDRFGAWTASASMGPNRYRGVRLTTTGLNWYGTARLPDYTQLLQRVAGLILDGEHWGPTIAEKIQQPEMLTDHLLEMLELNGYVELSRSTGGRQVIGVHAKLRRAAN